MRAIHHKSRLARHLLSSVAASMLAILPAAAQQQNPPEQTMPMPGTTGQPGMMGGQGGMQGMGQMPAQANGPAAQAMMQSISEIWEKSVVGIKDFRFLIFFPSICLI